MKKYKTDETLNSWLYLRPWNQHGLVLMVAGLAYVGIGISYIITEPTNSRKNALSFALAWWDFSWWGMVFVWVGVLCVISSRWPIGFEMWGYWALAALSAGWGTFYLMGIIFTDASNTTFSSVCLWYLVAFLWCAISGLRNPEEIRR